ncbi:hypothetical protein BGX27_001695, partial [Mortierella sp. AM989]
NNMEQQHEDQNLPPPSSQDSPEDIDSIENVKPKTIITQYLVKQVRDAIDSSNDMDKDIDKSPNWKQEQHEVVVGLLEDSANFESIHGSEGRTRLGVKAILDIGCGPDASITGIDVLSVFPSTIIPSNCKFIQHNILDGLPFPDNTFGFVYQRLLVAGLKPEDWATVLKEIERVTKPGGWIELVEADGTGGIVNVVEDILRLPTGDHGGKIGKLLKENELPLWSAITPVVIHGAGVDKEEYEETVRIAQNEVEDQAVYNKLAQVLDNPIKRTLLDITPFRHSLEYMIIVDHTHEMLRVGQLPKFEEEIGRLK